MYVCGRARTPPWLNFTREDSKDMFIYCSTDYSAKLNSNFYYSNSCEQNDQVFSYSLSLHFY